VDLPDAQRRMAGLASLRVGKTYASIMQ